MPLVATSSAPLRRASLRAAALAALLGALTAAVPAAHGQRAPAVNPAHAQAAASLAECTAAAEARQAPEALAAGKRAEAQFRALLARDARDADAVVGVARAVSQCLLPSADFVRQGELSAEAVELLQTALELDPTHWTARYILASIYFRSPSFLGRAPLAARELDELLRQQGDRTDSPRFARAFELRGRLYSQAGQADSALALWTRGSRLFPADSGLRALSAQAPPVAPPAARPPESATDARLDAVRVVASVDAPTAPPAAVRQVSRATVLMTAGGTADVMQAVQMQPGATRVTEGSDVYTRGGGASETALLVDGGRMASLSRFEGLSGSMFGALDPFVVKAVRYSSGAFSARHGNALSGVLEIETDGRPRERQVRAGLSMAQGSATVRIPLARTVGAWIGGRVSNAGVILATHGRRAEFDAAPHSEELIASLIANPSPTSELRATVVAEQDDARRIVSAAGWRGPFHSAGTARSALLSSRWMPGGSALVVRSSVAGNVRTSAWDYGVLARDRDERGLVGRADLEWAPRLALTVRGGVEHGRFSRRESGALPTTASVAPGAPTRALDGTDAGTLQVGGYGEAEVRRAGTALLVGVRADRLPGETQVTVDPRVSVSTRRGAWTGRLGGGVFHQGRWQATPAIPDAGTPAGTPREARHLVAGIEHEGATTLRAEAFDKRYGDYVAQGDGPPIASARARGMDVSAQRAMGARTTGWVSYSLLDAAVRLADGRQARSPYDVTHSLTTSATVTLGADWSLGATARYGTGAPITPVLGATRSADGRHTPVYGAPTSERLPAYGRLDARLTRFIRAPRFLLTSFVEAINVTDRANASAVTYDAAYRTRQPVHSFFASRTIVVGGELQLR